MSNVDETCDDCLGVLFPDGERVEVQMTFEMSGSGVFEDPGAVTDVTVTCPHCGAEKDLTESWADVVLPGER